MFEAHPTGTSSGFAEPLTRFAAQAA